MKPIFKYLCIPALITLPVSSACADEVVELPNQRLMGSSYDYTGKDLVLKWEKGKTCEFSFQMQGLGATH